MAGIVSLQELCLEGNYYLELQMEDIATLAALPHLQVLSLWKKLTT